MIRMEQYSYIRTAHRVYEKSIKQISRETGHSRKTISKILRQEPYGYAPRTEQPYPVLEPYLPIIDQWLTEEGPSPRSNVIRPSGSIIAWCGNMVLTAVSPTCGIMSVRPRCVWV